MNNNVDVVLYQELIANNGKKIGVATLNAEKSLNALSLPMVESLLPKLLSWQQDASISMVMLQGMGDKAFCAGGDIRDLYKAMLDKPGEYAPYVEEFFTKEYTLDYLIHTYGKPVLVWGNGIVMGGGLGLMAGASHKVVCTSSRIAMPEMAIGLYPDVGASWFLNRMPEGCGLFLGLTGASINAADAKFIGLADHFILHENKNSILEKLQSVNWGDTIMLNHQKLSDVLRVQEEQDRVMMPLSQMRVYQKEISQLAKLSQLDEVISTILAMQGTDKWLVKAKESLTYGSPITAHIVFELLKLGQSKILAESFRLELGLSVQCGKLGEFTEGVRALLMDKDLTPNWLYKTVQDVPQSVIDELFRSPWAQDEHPLKELGKLQQR